MIQPLRLWSILFFFIFLTLIQARQDSLYSSSVSYCSTPDAIIIEQFDARYFKDNSSLVFDLTASTVLDDLNVTAKVTLNAYGMEPVDLSFNLCQVSTALCPLPKYNFSGAATVPIPVLQEKIPDVAYVIPDLEAAMTFQLVRIETNETVACVQVTLSNGWSTRQKPVSWLVGGLFIFALFISCVFTFTDVFLRHAPPTIPYPLIPSSLSAFAPHPRTFISTTPLLYRFLTLLFFLQHIVLTSILDLNYPLLYRSFALNFSWAFGLFATDPKSDLQKSIYSLRSRTGSNNTDAGALAPLEYTSRDLSPYNGGQTTTKRALSSPPTVIESQGDALSGGITLYSNSLGIAEGNAFLSLFYVLLFIFVVGSVAAALGYALVRLVKWVWLPHRPKDENNWTVERRYLDGVKAIAGRVLLGLIAPAFVLVLFQWTLGDSWLAVLLSVLTIVTLSASFAYSTWLLVKVYRHHAWSKTTEFLPYKLTPYTEPWATHRWFTTVAGVVPILILKSAFTSFAKSSGGFVQVVAFIVMDAFALVAIVVFKPGNTKTSDVLEGFLAFVRLVTSCCLVAFVESVKVKPIPRVAVGMVLLVLESIVIVVLFLGVLRNVVALVVAGVKRKMDGQGVGLVEHREEFGEGGDRSSERKIRAMTMATTTMMASTDINNRSTSGDGGVYGGGGAGRFSAAEISRSGATTPTTDTRSILPPFAKEVEYPHISTSGYSTNTSAPQYHYPHQHQAGYSSSSFDNHDRAPTVISEKPETIYPKSYAQSSTTGGLGLSTYHGAESKLSFDAFTAPIHAKYSTAGLGRASSSDNVNFSDSGHGGYHHRYPSVVLEGDEKGDSAAGASSPATMVSDIRMGFVRGEEY